MSHICSAPTCACSTNRFDQRALAERLVTDFANHVYFPAELELLFLSTGFEIAQQYGDYRFVRVDRTSPYVVTVARRPRRSSRGPDRHTRPRALRFEPVNRLVRPTPLLMPDTENSAAPQPSSRRGPASPHRRRRTPS